MKAAPKGAAFLLLSSIVPRGTNERRCIGGIMRLFVMMLFSGGLLVACAAAGNPTPSAPVVINRSANDADIRALDFIPEAWRDRVRPVRSVRLSDHCADLREINATPPGTTRQAFLYQCSSVPQFVLGGEEILHWLDATSLEEISATRLASMFWRSQIALRDGEAFAYFEGTPIRLLSSSGQFTDLPHPASLGRDWSRDLSPAGRFFLRMTRTEFVIIDGQSNDIAFRTETNAPYYLVRQASSGLQLVGSRRTPDCVSLPSCPSEVIVLDSATREVHRIAVPNGVGAVVPRPYGERQVIVTTEPPSPGTPRGIALIDLDRLAVVWSGATLDTPPAHAFMCGPLEFEGDSRDFRLALHVSLNGSGFVLESTEGQAPTRCAVTGDGRHLAVVSPPFIHVYEINARRSD
jgi:hypothetical protein